MINLVVFLSLIAYSLFFIADRKRALLALLLLKLPLDQIAWSNSVLMGSLSVKISEVLTVFVTLLCAVTLLMDKVIWPLGAEDRMIKQPDNFRGRFSYSESVAA